MASDWHIVSGNRYISQRKSFLIYVQYVHMGLCVSVTVMKRLNSIKAVTFVLLSCDYICIITFNLLTISSHSRDIILQLVGEWLENESNFKLKIHSLFISIYSNQFLGIQLFVYLSTHYAFSTWLVFVILILWHFNSLSCIFRQSKLDWREFNFYDSYTKNEVFVALSLYLVYLYTYIYVYVPDIG